MAITVLLADDHQLVREGLRALLECQPDIRVVAEARDGAAAVELARKHRPDVVVMDIAMPKLSGIEATRLIRSELAETRVIVLSMHGHQKIVVEVLRAGATGYLLKDCAQEGLAQAIRAVKASLTFFSSGLVDTVIQEYAGPGAGEASGATPDLTHRERQVLTLIGEGQPTRQIAATLGVSVKTVETYRRQLMNKLEVKSVAGLTKQALRMGLVALGA